MTAPSSRRQILFSRDTLLAALVVVLLAAVCVGLGTWQYGRYEGKRDAAQVIRANYDAAPVPLADVLPEVGAPLPADAHWQQVTLHGSYCTAQDCVLHVRNRQLGTGVGFWQLAPFTTDDGVTMLVVRGWVPTADDAPEPADPPPVPEGERTVTVRLRPAEPVLPRDPPPGQTHSVNPPQSAGLMGLEPADLVAHAYGELVAEVPAAERPEALPSPDTSLGPHLSYAFQWWIFALFFPGALVYRTRRLFQDLEADERASEARDTDHAREDDDPREQSAAEDESVTRARPAPRTADHRPRRAARTRRRGHDEEEEDALIDQQKP